MYVYNVTCKLEMHRAAEWLLWMQQTHIPDVMATGFFVEFRLCRLSDNGEQDGVTFVIQYIFNTMNDFINYRTNCAPGLQKQHIEKFGNDAVAFRTIMEIIEQGQGINMYQQ